MTRRQISPVNGDAALVPARAGIGAKSAHYRELIASQPSLAFIEVHTENFMGAGGPSHAYLEALANIYPLSLHGVGMSLGGSEPLDREHLARWKALVQRYQPALVSEHIAWSRIGGVALHDLLPIAYTKEALAVIVEHIDEMQNALGRRILVENPSTYLTFRNSEISEAEFLAEVAIRSGCGLLLDVNNVYVSARNHLFDARSWLRQIPGKLVGEVHLAGHSVIQEADFEVRIDDHGSRVCQDVWDLYRESIARMGAKPTLIEWDTDVPELAVLLEEAVRADEVAVLAVDAHDNVA